MRVYLPLDKGGMDIMEELLLDTSLESVVEKAEELESVLRSAKNSLWSTAAAEDSGLEGVNHTKGEGLGDKRNGLSCPYPALSPSLETPLQEQRGSPADMATHWQSLTSYIVSLEKELDFYKLLVEDTQQLLIQRSASTVKQDNDPSSSTASGNGGTETEHSAASSQSSVVEKAKKAAEKSSQPGTSDADHYWSRLVEDDPKCRALFLVFSYLSTAELCSVSRVCQKWYTLSKHPLLWRRVSITETVITPQVLSTLSQWCTQTESLTLHGLMPAMASIDEDLLTYIGRTRGCLESALTAILATCSNTLTSLTISECNLMITDHMMWIVSIHCPKLKAFDYCSDEFPPSSEALWSLANGCQCLQHLVLPPVLGSPNASWFSDSSLSTIAHHWTNLLSLTVGGRFITSTGLAEIATYCRGLRYLEVIHGPDIDRDTIELLCQDGGLSSLESLILNFTPSSRIALEHLIDHCPKLTSLHLHITLSLYFPDSSDPSDTATYERIVSKLRSLEKHARGKNIFHLHEHYYGSASH